MYYYHSAHRELGTFLGTVGGLIIISGAVALGFAVLVAVRMTRSLLRSVTR